MIDDWLSIFVSASSFVLYWMIDKCIRVKESAMKKFYDKLMQTRHYLHQHPELSGQEFETTAFLKGYLEDLDIRILESGLKTGLVAEVGSGKPVIALRADIDALPILEQTGLSYASQNSGVMHACGHDFHQTSLLGAAELLKAMEGDLRGTVRLIFQPAEETSQGASQVLATGLLDDVSAIIGFHNMPQLKAGQLALKAGAMMAGVEKFKVEVEGVSSHAARPDLGVDTVLTLTSMIQNLQPLVARTVSPFEAAVLSVTHIEAGATWNVLPQSGFFEGTIRTFNKEVERQMTEQFEKMIVQTADVYGQKGSIEWILTPPVVHNDVEITKVVRRTTEKFATVVTPEVTLGAEDFANYMEHVPGCFVFIGTGCPHEWHHPAFLVDDAALPFAIQYFVDNTNALLEVLSQKGNA